MSPPTSRLLDGDTGDHVAAVILRELRLLRNEVAEIKRITEERGTEASEKPMQLRFRFEKNASPKFPYELHVAGSLTRSYKLTDVRAAMMLVLLSDCKDVLNGGGGIADRLEKCSAVISRLQGESPSRKSVEMGIGRLRSFEIFTDTDIATAGIEIRFRKSEFRLEISSQANGRRRPIQITISSGDETLRNCIVQELAISQLERVRQHHILYVHGGPDGFDQLFLEFFDHEWRVHETSMFFKPSIISYPDGVLEVLRASPQDRRRKEIAYRDLNDGRCTFMEILNRTTLDEMLQVGERGGFRLYGTQVTSQHVLGHFDNLINQVERLKGYELVLTDAPLPFLFSTFEIESPTHRESFTVFFRQLVREHDADVDCFAIYDEGITRSILDNVVSRVLRDPSTTRDRKQVTEELSRRVQELKGREAGLQAHG